MLGNAPSGLSAEIPKAARSEAITSRVGGRKRGGGSIEGSTRRKAGGAALV